MTVPSGMQTVKAIKNLEISSLCNLSCVYCPAKDQMRHREVGLMSDDVLERSLYWLRKFVQNGTQAEINVFGVGEPMLHPKVVEIVRKVRRAMTPDLRVLVNTNGLVFTEELCRALYDAGITKIDITDHEARATMETIRILRRVTGQYRPDPNGKWGYSRDGVINPNDWGGIVTGWVQGAEHQRFICPWLNNGQVMIMSNGDVTRCCQDAFARGVLGTVWDEIDQIPYSTFVQCETCHEIVPNWIRRDQERKVQAG